MMREPVQLSERRKSQMDLGETYFWTASIHKWNKLLWNDAYKDIIINSWDYLSGKGKIDVFGFVIMPTHLHCIWRMNEMNGREKPHASFMKFTAHAFERKLLTESPRLLARGKNNLPYNGQPYLLYAGSMYPYTIFLPLKERPYILISFI